MQSLLKKTSLLPCSTMGRGRLIFFFFLLLGNGIGFGQSFTIVEEGGVTTTSETGTTDTFTVVLDTQP
ncbi:hypothetical protein, partial [Flagellimonas marinaquae]|uniref:hypothetical protein n=1 Tax=Flagellimonas marinaquae TaxID=254955 RepID=UPI0019D22479